MTPNAWPTYERYKDSGVEWIGKVPADWRVEPGRQCLYENKDKNTGMKESTVLSLSYGRVIVKDEDKLTGLVPESFETYQIVQPGDIIVRGTDLQNDMTSLRTGLARNTGIITSAYINLRPKAEIDPAFLHYLLHSYDVKKVFYALGSGLRQNLSYDDFKYLRLPIPSPVEQRTIVAFLNEKCAKVDEAVRIKEEQIQLLRERRQIMIQEAVTRGLNPDAPLKDSGVEGVGMIPAHWEVKPCRYAFRSVRRSDRDGSEIKLSVTQKRGIVPTDEMEEHSNQARDYDDFQICHPNDLVLNKYKAHLGVFWMSPVRGIITNNYTVFRPLRGIVSKYFEVLFHSAPYITIFRNTVYGVTEGMAPLYTGDFYALPAICPPEVEQLAILKHIAREGAKFEHAIDIKQQQIAALKEYKTSLIDAAVTGKIKAA
jgi:type I restriction enzyme S subunit